MAKLKINAPDGKVIRVDIPEGTSPDKYDSMVEEVLADYESSKVETPGALKSGALGVMSGIPGAQTVVSGIEALGDKTFEEAQKETEIQKEKAWEEHPVAYGAGKTAGLIGSSLAVPSSAVTTIPRAIATGAAMGGLSGLDVTKKIEDIPENVTKGAVMGGAFGGVGKGVLEPAIETVATKIAPAIGKGTVAAIGKPTREQIDEYLQNPEAIRQALTKPQIAEKVAESTSELGKVSGHLSEAARSTLDPTNAPISAMDIRPIFEGAKQQYLTSGMPVSAIDESAIKLLDDQYSRLLQLAKQNNGVIPEPELRLVIDKLQSASKFNEAGNVGTSLPQKVAGDLQFRLKELLEQANPTYKQAMAPSAEAASLSGRLADTFGIEKGKATDKTVRQVRSLLDEPKIEEQQVISELKDLTGTDIADLLKKAQSREAFETPGIGAALRTFLSGIGFGAGKVSGVPFGGIGGAAAGRFSGEAVHGGNVAKKILDAYINKSQQWKNSAIRPALEKYGKVLADAAKLGGNQLAATHFVLGTSDPEYQQLEDELMRE